MIIGGLLLMFGLQWLRKAVLRSAGLKDMHDELRDLPGGVRRRRGRTRRRGSSFDGYAFAVCFKGVLLEGLEVAFIVLTVGANQHRLGLAAAAAGVAVLVVVGAGVAARAPLARVPENTLKLLVGVMLTLVRHVLESEGAGASWPGGEAALLAIVPGHAARGKRAGVGGARCGTPFGRARCARARAGAGRRPRRAGSDERNMRRLRAAARAVWEFIVGDDPLTAAGVVLALALAGALAGAGVAAWWVMPLAAFALLALSVRREARHAARRARSERA